MISDPPVEAFAVLGCDARGRVAWSAGAVEALCGRVPEALHGRPVVQALGELDAPARASLEQALAKRASRRLATGTLALDVMQADGPVPGACVVLRSTQGRDVLTALAESEERYRQLVEACPEPIVVHVEGRIAYANPAALAMLGVRDPEAVVGHPVMEFVPPEDRGQVAERMQKIQETGAPAMLLGQRILRPDGRVLEVEIAGAPTRYEGKLAIQLVGRDVTERRRIELERRQLAEQLREARHYESLLRLAEGVAQPLRRLSSELLEAVDQGVVRVAERGGPFDPGPLRRVGRRIAALTDQLLAFVGKRDDVRPVSVNLSALVLEVSEGLDAELGARASLSYDLPVRIPLVRADRVQMRRVVRDLVRNAADALGTKGGRILVRIRPLEMDRQSLARVLPPAVLGSGPCVALEVQDAGCGMDESTRARACEPFFSTHTPPGRGLGLAEVVGLMGAQGGGLRVQSTPGRGTTVTLLFPVCDPAGREPHRSGSQASSGGADFLG